MWRALLLVGLAGLCAAQRQRPWQEEDKYWKMKVDRLGETASLNCTVHNPPPYGVNSSYGNYWLLNNLTFLSKSSADGKYTIQLEGTEPILIISNVTAQDFGMYHCIRNLSTGRPWMIRRGLNLQGPYFENLAQKYRNNIIIGVSACLGFVAFMTIVCLSYHFRWPRLQERFGRKAQPADEEEMKQYERPYTVYNNTAYQVEDGLPVREDGLPVREDPVQTLPANAANANADASKL